MTELSVSGRYICHDIPCHDRYEILILMLLLHVIMFLRATQVTLAKPLLIFRSTFFRSMIVITQLGTLHKLSKQVFIFQLNENFWLPRQIISLLQTRNRLFSLPSRFSLLGVGGIMCFRVAITAISIPGYKRNLTGISVTAVWRCV